MPKFDDTLKTYIDKRAELRELQGEIQTRTNEYEKLGKAVGSLKRKYNKTRSQLMTAQDHLIPDLKAEAAAHPVMDLHAKPDELPKTDAEAVKMEGVAAAAPAAGPPEEAAEAIKMKGATVAAPASATSEAGVPVKKPYRPPTAFDADIEASENAAVPEFVDTGIPETSAAVPEAPVAATPGTEAPVAIDTTIPKAPPGRPSDAVSLPVPARSDTKDTSKR